jgi:hypothetical protein
MQYSLSVTRPKLSDKFVANPVLARISELDSQTCSSDAEAGIKEQHNSSSDTASANEATLLLSEGCADEGSEVANTDEEQKQRP